MSTSKPRVVWRWILRSASSSKTPTRAWKPPTERECEESTSARRLLWLHLLEITHDLRAGPDLRADELATHDALPVDHVGLRNLRRSIESIYLHVLVPHSEEIDMVLHQEPPVHIRVLIDADCDHRDLRHLLLELQQAGQLLDTRRAIRRPQVQEDDAAAQLAQVNGSRPVAHHELRRRLADPSRVIAPVAPRRRQQNQNRNRPEFTHNALHFL